MELADIKLARRLERAEGDACRKFAEARGRMKPALQSEWKEIAGAYAVFDGVESPITQCFGLGLFEETTAKSLEQIEEFFKERSAPVAIELCPLAGIPAIDLLVTRGYRPVEVSSVMYREVERLEAPAGDQTWARRIDPSESALWTQVSADGWAAELPDLRPFLMELGSIFAQRENTHCYLAGIADTPGAAGVMNMFENVSLFGGAATIPAMRRKGLQGALLRERMAKSLESGCDLAMMVAEAGSGSQRNAERQGFRIAYTRTKWLLKHA